MNIRCSTGVDRISLHQDKMIANTPDLHCLYVLPTLCKNWSICARKRCSTKNCLLQSNFPVGMRSFTVSRFPFEAAIKSGVAPLLDRCSEPQKERVALWQQLLLSRTILIERSPEWSPNLEHREWTALVDISFVFCQLFTDVLLS